jgi:hypothetical protein
VIRIIECKSQRIAENRRRFVKRNSMYSAIPRSFARVPFKGHGAILARRLALKNIEC